jgi:hypothetical protein
MSGWAIAYLVLMGWSLGIALEQHGTPKTGDHSFWPVLIAAIIQSAIMYMAGLFN